MGVGLMISVEKLLNGDFYNYDYIYTHASNNTLSQNIIHRPQGKYIVCYHKGEASTLSYAYQKIISFAKENKVSTTSSAGGLCLPLQGNIAVPPEGGLANHSLLVTGDRLKAVLCYSYSESPSIRSLSYCSVIYFFIVSSFTLPTVSQ